jgi:hypothetical protein
MTLLTQHIIQAFLAGLIGLRIGELYYMWTEREYDAIWN